MRTLAIISESIPYLSKTTMGLANVYRFYQRMEDENMILSFKGEFTTDVLTSMLDIIEFKLSTLGVSGKRKKSVVNVLVECFQNVYHHFEESPQSADYDESKKTALVMVQYVDDNIVVSTGNYILNESVEELQRKLDEVNGLSHQELRRLYQQKLLGNDFSEKGTAGLGLIDIVRKSKSKIDHEFISVDERCSFFCLNVLIE